MSKDRNIKGWGPVIRQKNINTNTYLNCMIVSCHLEVVVVHPGQEVCRGCCRGRVLSSSSPRRLTSTEVQGEAAEPGGPAGDQADLVTSQQERGLLGQVQQLGGRHQQLWGEKMLWEHRHMWSQSSVDG